MHIKHVSYTISLIYAFDVVRFLGNPCLLKNGTKLREINSGLAEINHPAFPG